MVLRSGRCRTQHFPAPVGGGKGVGSVISRNKTEGYGRCCVLIKTLTPPQPLPYRGGETLDSEVKQNITQKTEYKQ